MCSADGSLPGWSYPLPTADLCPLLYLSDLPRLQLLLGDSQRTQTCRQMPGLLVGPQKAFLVGRGSTGMALRNVSWFLEPFRWVRAGSKVSPRQAFPGKRRPDKPEKDLAKVIKANWLVGNYYLQPLVCGMAIHMLQLAHPKPNKNPILQEQLSHAK